MKAIRVEAISKQYRLGQVGTGSFAHDINRWWAGVRGKEDPYLKIGETNDRTTKGKSDYVWSLKDVSFDIEQGDSVGIIGRNGAGKSTLLKILSRVTAPTTGSVKVRGRVASLLEVGTGFHPDLSGRENIYLNGAILGMRKAEITRKFDEIVDFAGVERYIDTPVKRYSSGMYVRLAFAVAANLESEILIVDEVLAVGDAEFQKKCLGKMGEVSRGEGRTILFVSHNITAIQKLCNRGMLLTNGQLTIEAPLVNVIDKYLTQNYKAKTSIRSFDLDTSKVACVKSVELLDSSGNPKQEFTIGEKWVIRICYQVNNHVDNFVSAIGLMNPAGLPINSSWQPPLNLRPGVYYAEFKQNEVVFATGIYKITLGLSIGGLVNVQFLEEVIDLEIVPVVTVVDENVVKYDANTTAILNQLTMKTEQIQIF